MIFRFLSASDGTTASGSSQIESGRWNRSSVYLNR